MSGTWEKVTRHQCGAPRVEGAHQSGDYRWICNDCGTVWGVNLDYAGALRRAAAGIGSKRMPYLEPIRDQRQSLDVWEAE